MDILITLILICFLTLVGITVADFFNFLPKFSFLEKLPIAYGLGFGVITLEMLLLSLLKISWSMGVIIIPWIIIFGAFLRPLFLIKPFSFDKVSKILILGIILTAAFVVFESLIRPLSAWDGWANWFIGGKAFFLSKSFDPKYIIYANNTNPPFVSILIALAFTFYGHVNDQASLLLFSTFYIAILGTFFVFLKQYLPQKQALLFTFLLATTENLIRHGGRYDVGNADIVLSYFFLLSGLFFLEFIKSKSKTSLILLNISLGLSTFVKVESYPFVLIFQAVITWYCIRHQEKNDLFFSLIWFVLILPWQLLVLTYHFPINPFLNQPPQFVRIIPVLLNSAKEFLNLQRWNLLWTVFFASLPFILRNRKLRLTGIVCVIQILTYMYIYLTTPLDPIAHIQGSFDRLLLQVCPLSLFLIAVSSNSLLKNNL